MASIQAKVLTIGRSGGLEIHGDGEPVVIQPKTLDELEAIMREHRACLVSSTIDFPEDSTDDPTVIRLCRELRRGHR